MPDCYPFLSPEWLAAILAIREEYKGRTPVGEHTVKMNQIITEVPFGEPTLNAHMDTSTGELDLAPGHLDDAEVTVTIGYETARAIFVDPSAAMTHFMAGRIKVQGDLTKLIALIQANPDPVAAEVQHRMAEVTEMPAPAAPVAPAAPELP